MRERERKLYQTWRFDLCWGRVRVKKSLLVGHASLGSYIYFQTPKQNHSHSYLQSKLVLVSSSIQFQPTPLAKMRLKSGVNKHNMPPQGYTFPRFITKETQKKFSKIIKHRKFHQETGFPIIHDQPYYGLPKLSYSKPPL